MADFGAGADAIPIELMARPRDARQLRGRAASDRGAEEPHGGPDKKALEVFPIRPMATWEAIQKALAGSIERSVLRIASE